MDCPFNRQVGDPPTLCACPDRLEWECRCIMELLTYACGELDATNQPVVQFWQAVGTTMPV